MGRARGRAELPDKRARIVRSRSAWCSSCEGRRSRPSAITLRASTLMLRTARSTSEMYVRCSWSLGQVLLGPSSRVASLTNGASQPWGERPAHAATLSAPRLFVYNLWGTAAAP
jgi:hypothetical protein